MARQSEASGEKKEDQIVMPAERAGNGAGNGSQC
jgi:hypothetical protein